MWDIEPCRTHTKRPNVERGMLRVAEFPAPNLKTQKNPFGLLAAASASAPALFLGSALCCCAVSCIL